MVKINQAVEQSRAVERGRAVEQPVAQSLEVLEQIAADRGLLERVSSDEILRLMRAAGRVAVPDRMSKDKLRLANRKREKAERARQKAEDELLLAQTGIRLQNTSRSFKQACAPAPFEPKLPPTGKQPDEQFVARLISV